MSGMTKRLAYRDSLSTADALLIACAHAHPTPVQLQSIRGLVSQPLDWKHLIRSADSHNLAQLLASNLEKADAPVPPGLRQHMRMAFLQRCCEANRMAGELVRLVELLAKSGIRSIALKGPTLAAAAYGDVGLRLCVDLDILVHQADAPRAARLLQSIGYNGWDWQPHQDALHLRVNSEHTLISAEWRIIVDLHWALSPGIMRMPATFDELWKRSVEVKIAGAAVRALSPEELIMFLALHGAKHQWCALGLVCELAELIRANPGVDWDWVHRRSRELGMLRILHMGLFLARDLLDAPLPRAVNIPIERDSTARNLALGLRRKLLAASSPKLGLIGNARRCLFTIRVRERIRDRLRFLFEAALPSPRDVAAFELPPLLQGLYPLLRPLRILARHSRPFRGRLSPRLSRLTSSLS
jgi:hypothetical protein